MPFIFTYKKVITTYTLFALALSLSPMGIAHAVVNITEVTPVPTFTNDNTPVYEFNADGIGNIIY